MWLLPTIGLLVAVSWSHVQATSQDFTCEEGYRNCGDGLECTLKEYWCDSERDCQDGSDEGPHCENFTCEEGYRKCDDGLQCQPKVYWCDSEQDCQDGSDEGPACDVPTTTTTTTTPKTTITTTTTTTTTPKTTTTTATDCLENNYRLVNNRCFRKAGGRWTYSQAASLCRQDGAELLSLNNDDDVTAFLAFVDIMLNPYARGMRFWAQNNDLSDVSHIAWAQWDTNEPVRPSRCLVVRVEDNLWRTANCGDRRRRALCVMDPSAN